MKFNIEFTLEESSYINTIPGSVVVIEEGEKEGTAYQFTLMEKVKPLEGQNRYKIKWTAEAPLDAENISRRIIKEYQELESA